MAGGDGQDDEEGQHDDLGNQEGRLSAFGCQCMQCRDLREELCDEDENVQVESNRRSNCVSLAPCAREVFDVPSRNRHG